MSLSRIRCFALAAGALIAARPGLSQQQGPLVEITHVGANEHRVAGFVLTRPQFLTIEATGASARGRSNGAWWSDDEEQDSWPAAAWIIDARSRAVVWDLRQVATQRVAHVRRFTGPIRLPAGLYEAHFASYLGSSQLEREGAFRDFRFVIGGQGRSARPRELREPLRQFYQTAFVTLAPDSGGVTRVGFDLPRATDVEVVALGELYQRRSYDYGWIQDAATRQVLWRMEYGNTVEAGGAHKNRKARDTLHLAAGEYVATFVSSEEHNPKAWDAVPAYDPSIWGMTLRVPNVDALRGIHRFEWLPVPQGQTIASLLKIRNDEVRSQGFTLRQQAEVRVYALGECSDLNGEFNDGAWLMDLTRQRRAWEMHCNLTTPAGGASKNRLVDTLLRLEPGGYTLFYKSDGSHSTAGWNAAPPAEPQYWGVSLFSASGRLTPGLVGPPERDTTGIIAELTRVRDSRKSRRFFSLEAPTRVRIYALGEATGGEMHDFGWIENGKTGAKVWTMEYPATRHAGGAEKNRLVDSTITVPAGRYVLYYQTDDSHAYGDWNADPPDDPEAWGITLRRSEK